METLVWLQMQGTDHRTALPPVSQLPWASERSPPGRSSVGVTEGRPGLHSAPGENDSPQRHTHGGGFITNHGFSGPARGTTPDSHSRDP